MVSILSISSSKLYGKRLPQKNIELFVKARKNPQAISKFSINYVCAIYIVKMGEISIYTLYARGMFSFFKHKNFSQVKRRKEKWKWVEAQAESKTYQHKVIY